MVDFVGQTIDHYHIERFIGQGGMGSVYEAQDTRLERQVAVKVMHAHLSSQESFQQRFLEHIRSAAALDHPNIARIYAYSSQGETLYIVMEYIGGGSLTNFMQQYRNQNRPIPIADAVEIAAQMADALAYVHERGMIHRNLKPDNVLFKSQPSSRNTPSQQPILTDFGLAQIAATLSATTAGLPTALFVYMSPEQVMEQQVDHRTDIYALGAMFYEMVTGQPPFQPRNIMEALRFHQEEEIQPPSALRAEVSPELDNAILKCLETDVTIRYQTATELLDDLRVLQHARLRTDVVEIEALSDLNELTEDVDGHTQPDHSTEEIKAAAEFKEIPHALRTFPAAPPPDPGDFDRLMIVNARNEVRTITLDSDSLVLGREPECDVVLDQKRVSRRHIRIERSTSGVYSVTDLGSTNGTWLENTRLTSNVKVVWQNDAIIRIGDLWLRIDPGTKLEKTVPMTGVTPDYSPPEKDRVQYDTLPARSTEHRVDALLIPEAISVDPGGRANVMLEIINLGGQAEHFVVSAAEIPPGWVTLPQHSIHLEPNTSETVPVVFHPPHTSSSRVGIHTFALHIKSLNHVNVYNTVKGQLHITSFHDFATDLQPRQLYSGREVRIIITNHGNIPTTYRISSDIIHEHLAFELPAAPVMVRPGQTAYVPVRITSNRRHFFGSDRSLPFEVSIHADQLGGWKLEQGSLIVKPTLSVWMVGAFAVTVLILCAAITIGLTFASISATNRENALATEMAQSTATQVAFLNILATRDAADPDEDGLSNAEEADFGTDPDNPDTDGDGLLDGEEVDLGTDPLNVDTDGDGVLDGEEVNKGTNPITTDEDGILPSPTPTMAELDLSQPVDAVQYYYMEINERNYTVTWPLITTAFRYSNGTYNQMIYEAWWNSVEEVIVGDVIHISTEGNQSCVYAELTYQMVDGRTIVDDRPVIYLVRETATSPWIINAKVPGGPPATGNGI